MSEHIIIEGKGVEDAIEKGLKKLNVSREEVQIEILEEGKKGFLSIGHIDAKVKLTKKTAETEKEEVAVKQVQQQQLDEEEEPTETVVGVKNGEFVFKGPSDGEVSIQFSQHMAVFKNDERVEGNRVEITPQDHLRVDFDDIEFDTEWDISLNKEMTEALLTVNPGTRKTYKLKNHPYAKHISLQPEEFNEINLTLTADAVQKKLKELKVIHGIKNEVIDKAIKATSKDEFVIAIGEPPEEGKNGWLEYKVEVEEGKKFVEREDGTVDFRDTRSIPSVEVAMEIAVIHEPIPGTPGTSIKGEKLLPKPVHAITVKAGSGAELKEKTIYATSWGKPSIEKKGQTVLVDVIPILEHQRDVSLESGNLSFNGDIRISGSIEEGMKVEASGDIEIKGTTSKATIVSGKSITFMQNVIASKVTAGNGNKVIVEKGPFLEKLHDDLELLLGSFQQLYQQHAISNEDLQQKGLLPYLKLLISQKFNNIPNDVRKFVESVKADGDKIDEHWHELAKKLAECFIKMNPKQLRTPDEFLTLKNEVKQFYDQTFISPDDPATITLASAMNSDIFCSGDIHVIKQGCYNTDIHAGGFVRIDGYLRGGDIYAGKGMEIKEVGSKGGAISTLIVPKDGVIKIQHVMADTILHIGKQKYQFRKDDYGVVAKIDEDGGISVH